MATEIQVKGLTELVARLKALPTELASKNGGPLAKALYRAAVVIQNEARMRAPVRTGNLKRNIVVRRDRNPVKDGATEEYHVTVRKLKKGRSKAHPDDSTPFYWRFVEFGTQKMPAAPFMRPAFEAKKEEAVRVFEEQLNVYITKAENSA
jgi:HK97 gp10 family phage protein